MHLRKFTLALIIGLFGATYAADWYVDASASSDGADGSELKPFKTIQAAVDAASANDTIRVAKGVYAEGMRQVSNYSYARVHIYKKPGLKIVGAGRGKSFIVGSRDPNSNTNNDSLTETRTELVRCVYVGNSDNVIIEGFTLKDGETFLGTDTTLGVRNGGGLYTSSSNAYIVDCDIIHCCARLGAGIYGGTAVRCLIKGNYGVSSIASRDATLVNCILHENVSKEAGSYSLSHNSSLYNCTVYDNTTKYAIQDNCKIYNSVIGLSSSSEFEVEAKNDPDKPDVLENCVLASTSQKGWRHFLAPALGDFRLLPDSDAIGAGIATHLSGLTLPDGIEPMVDFKGVAIVPDENGKIHAGAVQETKSPAGGALAFKSGATYEICGYTSTPCNVTYAYPETYPTQFCVRMVLKKGQELFRLKRYDPATGKENSAEYPSVIPQRDGRMWLMPPLSTETFITNSAIMAGTVVWVDKNSGNDSWGDEVTDAGSSEHPYASIQKAIDAGVSGNTVIKVRPGDYNTGVTTNATYGSYRIYVNKDNVRIIAVAGPAETTIRGAADPVTEDNETVAAGLGTNAVKCAFLNGENIFLQGFTLADGYSDENTSSDNFQRGAAVYAFTDGKSGVISDCIITNCHAYGYVIYKATLDRCRVLGCRSMNNSVAYGGYVWGCYFKNCENLREGSSTLGILNCDSYQSTFVGIPNTGRLCGANGVSFNSIWDGGYHIYSKCEFTNSITWNIKNYNNNRSQYTEIDPLFVDRETDGILRSDSPAIAMGEKRLVDYGFAERYWRIAGGDVNGDPLVFTDGKCTVGAFQKTLSYVEVAVPQPANGGWIIEGDASFGDLLVYEGSSLNIVPASGSRPCIGVSCGGREYLFTNAPNEKIVLDYGTLSGMEDTTITGIYSTYWYVDDDGDDANTGFLPTSPKQTLSTAASLLAEGDTLWVFPGVYAEGSASHNTESTASRVVVSKNTSVISLQGPEATIIMGESAPQDADEYGNGKDAKRCAYVGSNARLEGFTLTGGRIDHTTSGETFKNGSAVFGGGRENRAIVANCIISNNVANMGTICKADAFNCIVVDNIVLDTGSGLRQGNAYNCHFARNVGSTVLSYPRDVWGTTVAKDNVTSGKKVSAMLGNLVTNGKVFNSLLMGKCSFEQKDSEYSVISNIVCSDNSTFSINNTTGYIHMVDFSTQSFVDGAVPVAGANEAVDAADESLVTNLYSKTDLRGFQRVMNGRLDIGAYEADWRENYASTLCSKQGAITVETASPEVRLEDGRIKIPSGTLTATWHNDIGKKFYCLIPVKVTGSGTLIVILDEETIGEFTVEDGDRVLEFSSDATENALEFVYSAVEGDTGCAVISGFTRSRRIGFAVSIR